MLEYLAGWEFTTANPWQHNPRSRRYSSSTKPETGLGDRHAVDPGRLKWSLCGTYMSLVNGPFDVADGACMRCLGEISERDRLAAS